MADPKIAALAKAMLESGGHVKWEGNGGWAEAIMLNHAEAGLRFLGCVDEKGEVVALGRGAVRKARDAVVAHVQQWSESETSDRDKHLVVVGGLLAMKELLPREGLLPLHEACGCPVCRMEVRALRGEGGET